MTIISPSLFFFEFLLLGISCSLDNTLSIIGQKCVVTLWRPSVSRLINYVFLFAKCFAFLWYFCIGNSTRCIYRNIAMKGSLQALLKFKTFKTKNLRLSITLNVYIYLCSFEWNVDICKVEFYKQLWFGYLRNEFLYHVISILAIIWLILTKRLKFVSLGGYVCYLEGTICNSRIAAL